MPVCHGALLVPPLASPYHRHFLVGPLSDWLQCEAWVTSGYGTDTVCRQISCNSPGASPTPTRGPFPQRPILPWFGTTTSDTGIDAGRSERALSALLRVEEAGSLPCSRKDRLSCVRCLRRPRQ